MRLAGQPAIPGKRARLDLRPTGIDVGVRVLAVLDTDQELLRANLAPQRLAARTAVWGAPADDVAPPTRLSMLAIDLGPLGI
jgi:hypothetical protein